jgi:methylmalonyl-CoA mutase cobalamin-binding subunit
MGVAAVFRPGTSMQDIIDFINGRVGVEGTASPAAEAKAAGPSGR